MKIRWLAFNIYLLAALLLAGCKTPQEKKEAAEIKRQKKELSTIRFHLEAYGDATARAEEVTLLRADPIALTIVKDSFLDERDVLKAIIVDTLGGFVIQVQFDDHGTLVFDNATASSKGKRIAVMSDFTERRWLAAPIITARVMTGIFSFTPDATREEAQRIVRGLNNASLKLRKKHLIPGV